MWGCPLELNYLEVFLKETPFRGVSSTSDLRPSTTSWLHHRQPRLKHAVLVSTLGENYQLLVQSLLGALNSCRRILKPRASPRSTYFSPLLHHDTVSECSLFSDNSKTNDISPTAVVPDQRLPFWRAFIEQISKRIKQSLSRNLFPSAAANYLRHSQPTYADCSSKSTGRCVHT